MPEREGYRGPTAGSTVRYIGASDAQVSFGHGDDPRPVLVLDDSYQIEYAEVHAWHTRLALEGVDGWFNSVHFEERAPRRECGCPPAIIMCAHLDGKLLVLASDDELRSGHTCGGGWRPFTGLGYGIHLTEDKHITCDRTPDCPAMVLPYSCSLCLEFDNEAEARAEFARCAELLRLGEPARA